MERGDGGGPYREGSGCPPEKRRPVWSRWLAAVCLGALLLGMGLLLNYMGWTETTPDGARTAWAFCAGLYDVLAFVAAVSTTVTHLATTDDRGWWQ